jgi:hypothetical protein
MDRAQSAAATLLRAASSEGWRAAVYMKHCSFVYFIRLALLRTQKLELLSQKLLKLNKQIKDLENSISSLKIDVDNFKTKKLKSKSNSKSTLSINDPKIKRKELQISKYESQITDVTKLIEFIEARLLLPKATYSPAPAKHPKESAAWAAATANAPPEQNKQHPSEGAAAERYLNKILVTVGDQSYDQL